MPQANAEFFSALEVHVERASPFALSFPDFLALLHEQKYTGAVTFHCLHGVPTSAALAQDPIQIRLSHRVALDTVKP